jgi:hypothetical protein
MADPRMGRASLGVTEYMQGGDAPLSPGDLFTMEKDKSNYLEMLARLLEDDEFKRIIAGWHGGDESAFATEPMYGAAASLGRRQVPTYVQQPGKTNRY